MSQNIIPKKVFNNIKVIKYPKILNQSKLIPGLTYIPNYISQKESDFILKHLNSQEWSQEILRRQQFYGTVYYHTRHDLPQIQPQDILNSNITKCYDLNFFDFLIQRLINDNIFQADYPPNQCLVNEYKGNQTISPHVEDKDAFGPIIAGISLQNPTYFRLQNEQEQHNIFLETNSIYILTGEARNNFKHGIKKHFKFEYDGIQYIKDNNYKRTSLTFRHVLQQGTKKPYGSTYSEYPRSEYSFIPASYVKYLEMAGARVVPIYYDAPKEYYDNLLTKLNGVLFTGGGQYFDNSTTLGQNGHYIYKKIKELNDNGIYFPLWGTCLGYEMLMTFATDFELELGKITGQKNVITKIQIVDEDSLFAYMPDQMKFNVQNYYLTYENHQQCVYEDDFYNDETLSDIFKLISISENDDGRNFVTGVQAKDYPFYGVQFHPEKNSFEWKVNANHTLEAVEMEQFYANFFVQQTRRNIQSFKDNEELDKYLIYNWNPVYPKFKSDYNQIYFFKNYDKAQEEKHIQKTNIKNRKFIEIVKE
ncbi:hypothetical protein PPERSA_12675 [Pseudocohnilembus persalinus]|uniref:folate gamma-glutamyl hydrolase n=1 Tax=Pseudocohnilembus persalinus TaxID=266149 RepID=A0A0V0QMF1_PSEPJ|nr:hypothetical protein PPERSA_12675 [Pseudocohnilembus persalinus]|eukprot:KRX03545.1 hypothetical protein PPERSA_12675 [Pseudocohnilembus persalinus]